MSDKAKPITANEAVRIMQSLPPGAMAWLLGCSPRQLRDRAGLPRNRDGSYDARVVFAHETQGAASAVMAWALKH